MKTSRFKKTLGTLAIVGALTLFVPAAAQAADETASGGVTVNGATVFYTAQHYHDDAGSVAFTYRYSSPAGLCGGALNVGLRQAGASSQYTNSLTFNVDGTRKTFARASNGASGLPVGQYQVLARSHGAGGCGYSSFTWYGTLHL